jgi:formiminotetrahydrofolate cyclodeaminase
MSLPDLILTDLLDAFASNEPVPGGGCAAALAGALGTSLLIMVAGLEKTKTGAPEEAADLAEASARLRPLRATLEALIDRDSAAYSAVIEAMRLPKGTEVDKNARRNAIEQALTEATQVPMETMRACQQALRGAVTVARNGNPNAASDAGVAVELLLAALRGAAMNVDANAGSLRDRHFVERVMEERRLLAAEGETDGGRASAQLRPRS